MGLRAFVLSELKAKPLFLPPRQTICLKNFRFSYRNGTEILRIPDCEIPAGQVVAVMGNKGAGKSTFSRCFCGLERKCGEIIWNGKKLKPKDRLKICYMVMQDVNHQLFTESVKDEIAISMAEENAEQAEKIILGLDLSEIRERHPMSLSGGQKPDYRSLEIISHAVAGPGRRARVLSQGMGQDPGRPNENNLPLAISQAQ